MSTVLRHAVHEALRGAKGGSSQPQAATEAPDSLHSIAYARILDLVSEGEIQGFAHPTNPLQDIYLDSTPLANADGSLNFKNVQVDSRSGTQSQTVLTGFPDVESETAVNLELKSTVDWTQTITDLSLTALRITLSTPALSKSNTSTGDIQGYSIQYEIDVQTDGGSWQTMLTSAFTGKTTSKYQRSHRIDLPAATSGWTVRVHRITANQNLATVADTMMVDSYTEIIDAKFSYPNSAVIGLIIDSSQFSSIPQRAYNLLGRIVSVPSNYNPTTRVYTGTWDGTFKPAWTNNPAWIFYDLATNARYGLGRYITAAQINKWNLYQIAQYCDGMVSDGMGGQEPRFTCSLFLQQAADAYKVMQDLAAVFRGISFWGAGTINAVADMPGDPVYTYTAANVLNGKFTYQGSSKTTRYTVALVSWNDPSDQGRAKVEYVPDRDGIARYGINITQVTATGATSRGQAQRVGLWTLLTSRLETETVTFGVGLDGTIAAPGQIIRIADPARAGKRQAGRIHSATATAITVDSPPTVAVGDSLTCTLPTGVTETHTVTAVTDSVISVAAPGFSAVPVAEAVWVTESASLVAATFRVVSVTENQAAPALGFTITALAHNASKFAAIDSGAPIVIPPITAIPPSVQPGPATVTLESFPVAGQVLTQTTLTIQWDATADAVYYRVEWRKDSGDWQQMPIQRGLSADVHVWPGSYVARVAAVNASGIGSIPTVSDAYVVVDQTQQSQVLTSLGTEVNTAQADADAANTQLANIASDNILSPAEKPTVMRDYSVITTEQAGIDAQALAYLQTGSSQQVAYDNAITALTTYLNGLTTPTAWNDKSGNTTIVGTTFRANFNAVYAARQALLDQIYAVAQALAITSGDNLLFNPGFESNAVGTVNGASLGQGAALSDGWYVYQLTPGMQAFWYNGAAHTGSAGLFLRGLNGFSVPANSGYSVLARVVSRPMLVNGGDTLTIGGWCNATTSGGLTILTRIGLYLHKTNGATVEVTGNDVAGATGGYQSRAPFSYTVGSDVTSVQLQCSFFIENTTGSPIAIPNNAVYAQFDDLWVTRNDLRVAGSGTQIGDVRQLPPTSTVGVGSVLSTSPIAFSISGTTVNFTTTAFSAYNSGVTTNYNAASASVTQAAGTTVTYYLYFSDPNYAGGSQTLHVTTSIQAMAQAPGLVNIGSCSVTVASGGGGSSGTGSGGGSYCVCDDMWIDADTQAKDAQPGHLFDCCDLPTRGTETFKRALHSVDYHDEECVRLTTDGGAQLDCGYTTPFDTVDGRVLRAPQMQGEIVLTDEGLQRVASVEWIGVRRVCYFHFGGVSYAAGRMGGARIFSHNVGGTPQKP